MIFCVEDDSNIRELVIYTLETTGFKARGFEDGKEFLEALALETPELILLDIMLPGMDGLELLSKLKASPKNRDIPVIMLTAKGAEYDKVKALDAGADDYLTKPISLKELLARLRSLERRVSESFTAKILTLGSVRLDQEEQELVAGNAIRLSSRETKLMAHFMLNPAKKLTTEHLFKTIWEDEEDVDESIVWVYISYLRQKLQAIQADISILGEKGGDFCLLAN